MPGTPVSIGKRMRAPPIDFGMTFEPVGARRRRGEMLPLFVGRAGPDLYFSDAYRHAREPMVAAGFSWTDVAHAHGQLEPCWWDHGQAIDLPALQSAVDAALTVGAEERAERERAAEALRAEAEKRVRAEVAEVEKSSAPIRAALDVLLRDRPWAFGRQHSEAADMAGRAEWRAYGLMCAKRLVENAQANIERAEQRLGRPAPAAWFARAADPSVREAALEACRVLSARDEDWASDQNGIGWSQATSWTGHVLSEREVLDQGSASHALRLLHPHRRQLDGELRARLFGGAPAPELASQLAL